MKKIIVTLSVSITLCMACSLKKSEIAGNQGNRQVIRVEGTKIIFPPRDETLGFFLTDTVRTENVSAVYAAPTSVAVVIIKSNIQENRNTVLFDDPDLNANYTLFIQHLVNIKQAQVTLDRIKDLSLHGASPAKEVQDAETNLADEEAAISEHEAKFKLAGLNPESLQSPISGNAWLICEIPEAQIAHIQVNLPCTLKFTAFGEEVFNGRVNGIGEEVDRVTRMVKVRVLLPNQDNRIKVGMFATATFTLSEGKSIAIPQNAVVDVSSKDYVFVKTSENTFDRREVFTGQQIGDRIIVLDGIKTGEVVVVKGAMQLKGLSFGY